MMLIIKTIIGTAVQLLLLAGLVLIPAGTFYWNDALIWLSAYAVVIGIGSIYLLKNNPEAIEARMRTGGDKQPLQDKLASTLVFTSLGLGFVVCPLDLALTALRRIMNVAFISA